MKISDSRLRATALIGVALGIALIAGCGNQGDEETAQGTPSATVSPQALATAAPILDQKRWRPGTGVRNPRATNAANATK